MPKNESQKDLFYVGANSQRGAFSKIGGGEAACYKNEMPFKNNDNALFVEGGDVQEIRVQNLEIEREPLK